MEGRSLAVSCSAAPRAGLGWRLRGKCVAKRVRRDGLLDGAEMMRLAAGLADRIARDGPTGSIVGDDLSNMSSKNRYNGMAR